MHDENVGDDDDDDDDDDENVGDDDRIIFGRKSDRCLQTLFSHSINH